MIYVRGAKKNMPIKEKKQKKESVKKGVKREKDRKTDTVEPETKEEKSVKAETRRVSVRQKPIKDEAVESLKKYDRYFEAVGRRKTAIARVRLFTKPGDFTINEKMYSHYFPTSALQKITEDSLQKMKLFGRFRVSAVVMGGGIHAQAEAIRHALARCLEKFNPDFRKRLKRAGFLKRDPRMRERKKFGLKKARKAPQWQKR